MPDDGAARRIGAVLGAGSIPPPPVITNGSQSPYEAIYMGVGTVMLLRTGPPPRLRQTIRLAERVQAGHQLLQLLNQ